MSDVVGTSQNIKPFLVVDSAKILNNAQEQEANDLSEFLKLEHKKYIQYKVLYDTLEDYVGDNNNTDKSLKSKIKDILLSESVAQNIILDDNIVDPSNTSVFGACCLNKLELNYIERNQLQEVLKLKLDEKYRHITNAFCKLTKTDINKNVKNTFTTLVPLKISPEDKILIDFKNKLDSEQEQYVKNLLYLQDLLMEITNLRLNKLPQVTEQKIRECQVQDKFNHLKSLLAQEKIRVDVFMETSTSLKAYNELIKDIKEQQRECQKEIEDLSELKEKYNQVACKQYDDILKSYIQYKSSIEKKKILYECLENKL